MDPYLHSPIFFHCVVVRSRGILTFICGGEDSIEIGLDWTDVCGWEWDQWRTVLKTAMGPVADCSEDGNGPSGSIKHWQLCDCPSEYDIVRDRDEFISLVSLLVS